MKSLEELYDEIEEKLAAMEIIPEFLTPEGKTTRRAYRYLRQHALETKTVDEYRARILNRVIYMTDRHLRRDQAGELVQDDLMDDMAAANVLLKYISNHLDGR